MSHLTTCSPSATAGSDLREGLMMWWRLRAIHCIQAEDGGSWPAGSAGLVYTGPNHIESTTERVKEILARPDRPTAMLCSNDFAALGVVRAASGLGLRVPDELSVVGFDDDEAASW